MAAAQRFFNYHRGLILLCVFRMLCRTTQSSHRATQSVVSSLRWQIFTKDLNPRQRSSCAVTAAAFISCTRRRLCTATFILSRINIFFCRSRYIAELISLPIDLRGSGSGTADTRAPPRNYKKCRPSPAERSPCRFKNFCPQVAR